MGGSHDKAIESLELTIDLDKKKVNKLVTFSRKRNKVMYDIAGSVSDQELREIVKSAIELKGKVAAWLEEHHPELPQP